MSKITFQVDDKLKRRYWFYDGVPLTAALFRKLGPQAIEDALMAIEDPMVRKTICENLMYEWPFWARPEQLLPNGEYRFIVVLAGRGFGKTRMGAEAVIEWKKQGYKFVNLMGATFDDAWDVMVFGQSGILAVAPPDMMPTVNQDKGLFWPDGSLTRVFTAEKPERLRGKQHQKIWADELAAWRYPEAWDQMLLGLRLPAHRKAPVIVNQVIVTTTPKPTKLIKDLIADPGSILIRGSTQDNIENLSPEFYNDMKKKYEGTRMGRQELYAEVLDDNPGALWNQTQIDQLRRYKFDEATGRIILPEFRRIIVAIDPSVTANENSDETGIIVAGLGTDGFAYILEDGTSKEKLTADQWATRALKLFKKWDADRIVAEVNNGGDLVESLLRSKAPNIPYKAVRASQGKIIRAEPIAALYEQSKVFHCGIFPELEAQMCSFNPLVDKTSPDRMDALVWALKELMLDGTQGTTGVLDFYEEEIKRLGMHSTIPQLPTLKEVVREVQQPKQEEIVMTDKDTTKPTTKKATKKRSSKSNKIEVEAAPEVKVVAPTLSAKERLRLAAMQTTQTEKPEVVQNGARQSNAARISFLDKRSEEEMRIINEIFADDLDNLDENE